MSRLTRIAVVLTAAVCVAVGPSSTAGSSATPGAAPASASDGEWVPFGPSHSIRGSYWQASQFPQKHYKYRLKRSASSHGKRQVRLRWQYTRADPLVEPKPGRWHKRTVGIRPGTHRRLGLRSGRCGNLVLWIDVLTRRKQPRHPKRWGSWEYLLASSHGRECHD